MSTLKSILWTVLGIAIVLLIIKFFIWCLPFVLVIALVGFIVIKGKEVFRRNNKASGNTYNTYETNTKEYKQSSVENDITGEVIDVDYKDADEK